MADGNVQTSGSASYELFTRWRAAKNIASDNAGAIALKLSRAVVSQWKHGRNAEIHVIAKMAHDLGDNEALWAALVMAERGQSADERRAWERIAKDVSKLVGRDGFEPSTKRLKVFCSTN